MINKIKRFLLAKLKWQNAGSPVRSDVEILRIYYEICSPCDEFENDMCKICGCRLKPVGIQLNKIAWGTEECPKDPPLWKATFDPENSSTLPSGGKAKKSKCEPCNKKKTM